MTKWFVHIAILLILIPGLSSFGASKGHSLSHRHKYTWYPDSVMEMAADTTSKKPTDDKKKIKEVSKAKHVPKPEKIDDNTTQKPKPKRQRRPPGLERPPEIPGHNSN
jgi:hypothetical protein